VSDRTRHSANTLIELLVVSGLFVTLSILVLGSWMMVNRTSRMQNSRIQARQQVRMALNSLSAQIRTAYAVFDGFKGNFGDYTYAVPNGAGGTGSDLLFAVPINLRDTPVLWKVCGVKVVPHEPIEPANPNALDILEQTAENVIAPSDSPHQWTPYDLKNLPCTPARRYQLFIDPLNWYFQINSPSAPPGYANCPSPISIFMQLNFKVKPDDTSTGKNYWQSESYQTEAMLRNGPPPLTN
jgi:type II secretory pathway pseudopilin PulG